MLDRDSSCKRCNLYKKAQSVCLLGQGPTPCDIMVIGEGPGKREDDINKPFQGAAGGVLDELFGKVGISRKKVYITNAVRCRPPSNRKPKISEIKSCSYWLRKELAMIKPKYILLLGATAIRAFPELGKDSITRLRGRFYNIGGYEVFPTFHPAATLYDNTKEAILKMDLVRFVEATKKKKLKTNPGFNPQIIDSFTRLHECYQDIEDNKIVSLDLECQSLDPWHGDKIVMVGIGTKLNQWIIPLHHEESKFRPKKVMLFKKLKRLLKDKKVVGQNGKFDSKWILIKHGVRIDFTEDTMLMSHLLDENTPNGLKYLASLYFGVPDYDITVEQKTGGGSLSDIAEYCAKDVFYTRKLYFQLSKELKKDSRLWDFYKYVMVPAMMVYRDIEYNGIYLDEDQMDKVEVRLTKQLNDSYNKLKQYGDINWNSPKQVSKLLFEELGLKPLEATKTGFSTSESVMKRLSRKHKAPRQIVRYREASKGIGTFLNGWRGKMVGERVHPTFNLIKIWTKDKSVGTVTGRPSAENPPLQQTPRDPELRSVARAPEGWEFLEADFSQIELRIVAMLSGDKAMKRAFQLREDIHVKTAIMVSGRDRSGEEGFDAKEWRKKAKAVNFGFVYGMGVDTFLRYARDKYDVIFTREEGEIIRDAYFKWYNGLRPWYKRQIRMARLNGYVRSLSGRIRHLPNINSEDDYIRSYTERQSINSPVQGLASDFTLMSAIEINSVFSKDVLKMVGTVHDSILMEVKKEHVKKVIPQIREIMTSPKLFKKLNIEPTVPIEVEISVGPWGTGIKEDEE